MSMYLYGMTPEEAHDNYIEEKAYKRGYEDAKKELDRPHGEWKTTPNPNHSPFDSTSAVIYICSQCAYSSGDRITATWNFCPNCGSDMRVETQKYVPCPCNHCRTFETTCKLTCDKYKKWKGGAKK